MYAPNALVTWGRGITQKHSFEQISLDRIAWAGIRLAYANACDFCQFFCWFVV